MRLKEHLGHVLKAKNGLTSFLDKMRAAASGDASCNQSLDTARCFLWMSDLPSPIESNRLCIPLPQLRQIGKLEAMQKDFESLYEELVDVQAEGQVSGFTEKPLDLEHNLFFNVQQWKPFVKSSVIINLRLENECQSNFKKAQKLTLIF